MIEVESVAMGSRDGGPKQKYILPYGKKLYAVPQSHVVCLPQKVNKLESADELGVLINSSAPEKWKPYCKHGYVAQLKGDEGTCPYTTFSVPGFPEEWRFLRHIKKVVADKIFPKLLEETEAKQPAPQNDRQRARIDVYRWTSKNDLPDKNQLSPEVNKWPEITSLEEQLRSCSITPQTQKRKKGGGADKNAREDEEVVKIRRVPKCVQVKVEVGPKGSYCINECDGFVHIINNAAIAEAEDAREAEEGNNEQDI